MSDSTEGRKLCPRRFPTDEMAAGDRSVGSTPGNAYVAGMTRSTDFPTVNALYPSFGGMSDAFFAKFNADGSALVYSTYLGRSDYDSGQGIALDSASNAYVASYTYSPNFPTVNALYPIHSGETDVFVTEINDVETRPDIQVSPVSHDFGPVYLGFDSLPQSFVVTNAGTV